MDYRLQHKIKLAKEFESQGKLLHSINIYNSIIDEYPDYIDAYLRLADLYEKMGSLDAAKSIYEIINKSGETENGINIEYGKFLMRTSQFKSAVDIFKKVSPEDEPLSSYLIGYVNLFLENYDEAKVHLLNYIISAEQSELMYEAYFYLANVEYELKQYEDSLKYLRKAEIILSDYWELHQLIAKIYYSQSMFNHAEINIMKAIHLNPHETLNYFWAGKICFANSEMEKSIEYFTKFIKYNDKTDQEQLLDRFNKLIYWGRFKDALFTYQKAKMLKSGISDAESTIQKSKTIINNK